jgi:hypothetical protein
MDTTTATVVRFRTALAGFHKGDVTDYISQSARANREMVNSLKQQILALQEENARLRTAAADSPYVADLEEKASDLADLQQENVLLKNRVRQLEFKLEEAEIAIQEAAQNPVQEAPAVQEDPAEDVREMELAAYRRAEEMERRVSQRARMLAAQLDGITQQSSQKLESAVDSAKSIMATIAAQLQLLRDTSEDLNFAMADSLEQMQVVASLMPDAEEDSAE